MKICTSLKSCIASMHDSFLRFGAAAFILLLMLIGTVFVQNYKVRESQADIIVELTQSLRSAQRDIPAAADAALRCPGGYHATAVPITQGMALICVSPEDSENPSSWVERDSNTLRGLESHAAAERSGD